MTEFDDQNVVLIKLLDAKGFVYEENVYGPVSHHEAVRFADYAERQTPVDVGLHYEAEVLSCRGTDEIPGWEEAA